ncbi:uncharacterized protein [Leuresthes tenuis]|uniref:uncharacterized protein isoform X2 n=1 Tax=Leuresthes tenuis TaxID=355514 RepID=UPI003B500E8D
MSLQLCQYCGWSKVTTYQGLRIHQGRMGCTLKGVRVAEPEQPYMRDYVVLTNAQMDPRLDIHTSFRTETTGNNSDPSLRVCHCGWTKNTTYKGLRIHQGKMGCTPKGRRIPKNEQYDWEEEVDHINHPRAEREAFSTRPQNTYSGAAEGYWGTDSFSDYAPAAARVNEEPKSQTTGDNSDPSLQVCHCGWTKNTTYRGLTIHQGKMGCTPKGRRIPKNEQYDWEEEVDHSNHPRAEREAFSTRPQVNRTVWEPSTPANPADVARAKKTNPKRQPPAAPVVRPKERGARDQTPPQVMGFVREHSPVTYPEPVAQPKQKHRQEPTWSQDNRSVKNQHLAPLVVPPEKKKDSPLCTARQERSRECQELQEIRNFLQQEIQNFLQQEIQNFLQQEIQNFLQRENKMRGDEISDKRRAEPAPENVSISPIITSPTTAAMMADNKSPLTPVLRLRKKPINIETGRQSGSQAKPLAQRVSARQETEVQSVRACEAAQDDFPTGRTVRERARMFSVLEPAARPTEKHGAKSKLSQKSTDSTRAATKTKPAAAAEDHSTALLLGFPPGPKVKDLTRMYSATRGAVGPKDRQAKEE